MRPFKPASPMKRATAPQAGELSGTISGRYAYILVSANRLVPSPAAAAAAAAAACSALVHESSLCGMHCILQIFIQGRMLKLTLGHARC